MSYNDEEAKQRISIALNILFKNDWFLLENRANERSIAHKIAEYMQVLFPEWNIDCEYNRKGLKLKLLEGIRECEVQRTTDRVYPDIIVHKRNTDDNLLVIEIKTISNEETCDKRKLELFTNKEGEYRYQLGLFIKFNSIERPELQYYKNGQQI